MDDSRQPFIEKASAPPLEAEPCYDQEVEERIPSAPPSPIPMEGAHQPDVESQAVIGVVAARELIFPRYPVSVRCPHCHHHVVSRVEYHLGIGAIVLCFLLLVLSMGILFWIPMCTNYFRDVYHFCPHCGCAIGIRPRWRWIARER